MNLISNKNTWVDPDIEAAFNWFSSFISEESWVKRKEKIEEQITIHPSQKNFDNAKMKSLSSVDDKFGWYLYLMECYLYDIAKYEPVQGARIAPIFSRLGNSLEELKKVAGLEKKVAKLLGKEKNQADAILFEILVALLWVRNGWQVEFISEAPPLKKPDILAKRNGEEWFIECKRLSKSSDYSEKEREKRESLISLIREQLLDLNLVLDITFHVEIETLADNFLYDQLHAKLPLIVSGGRIISNDILDVDVAFVDFKTMDDHLVRWNVKYPSTQITELIAGKRPNLDDATCGLKAKFIPRSKGKGNHQYVESIANAFAVFWKCDSPKSINAKSRDIRRQLQSAVEQLPSGKKCAIHIGLETLDGVDVEALRFQKIFNTVSFFDTKMKDIKWINCHFFQSYTPPQKDWIIDETVSDFSKEFSRKNDPLYEKFAVIPWDGDNVSGLHWERPKP